MNYLNDNKAKRESADIWDLIALIWAKRLWLLASVIIYAVIFTAVALLLTPVYRATTVLIPVASTRDNVRSSLGSVVSQFGGVASLAGLTTSDTYTQEALAVLQSQEFIESFISDRRLLPELLPERRWNFGLDRQPTLGKAFKFFQKNVLTVTLDNKTGLIAVQIDWKNRYEAADWANDLVARLNAEMRARAIQKANDSLGYLDAELKRTSAVPTRDAINQLIEEQIRERMLANVTKQYAFGVVDTALPPDANQPESPKFGMLIGGGVILGFVFGVLCIFLLDSFNRSRRVAERER